MAVSNIYVYCLYVHAVGCLKCIYISAKSLKNYTFHPKSHYLGQTYLKIAKILKINAYLGVAHFLQSYCTAVSSENS